MNKAGKIGAFLLAALFLLTTFAACKKKTPSGQKKSGEDESQTDRIPFEMSDNIKGVNLDKKEIRIWQFTKASNSAESFYDMNGNDKGSLVEQKIAQRNLAVETYLNCLVTFRDTDVYSGNVGDHIRMQLQTGSTDFDAYEIIQWNCMPLVLEGWFRDLSDAPYIDYERDWWSDSYHENTMVNGKPYVLAGDISIDMIRCAAAVFVNKTMLEKYYGNGAYDTLYEKIMDRKWTIDEMTSLAKDIGEDLNSNQQVDIADQFGFLTNYSNNIDGWFFGCGGTVLKKNQESGLYELNFKTERNGTIMARIQRMCFEESPDDFGNKAGSTVIDGPLTKTVVEKFAAGQMLFCTGFLYTAERFTNMEQKYATIPFPMLNENQERYYSVMHNIVTMFAIPANCLNYDATCAVFEAMSAAGHEIVVPEYYETMLKIRYSENPADAKMIDLIYESRMTDVGYVFENRAAEIPRYCIIYGMSFEWYCDKEENTINKGLRELNGTEE